MSGEKSSGKRTHLCGAPVMIDWVLDVIFPSLDLLPSVCQESCDPLTGGSWHNELTELRMEDFWDDAVECQVEDHKQDPCIPG